ncbi:ABC transporter substrate-binding protein [Sphingobium sufflavum]|uniref:ABC transporter substrate-binding protein n=1 Tax=Sphingobium sufflavum TaxID=1129547 RepID=UPI001F3CC6E1|nr:ABC transporter substrate-binding protein [Sphingobium sufflavum]MCE7797813.1 ABC transporter substrate-binding protein [Sphingobium sufflavum]
MRHHLPRLIRPMVLAPLLLLGGCGLEGDDGPVRVDIIGTQEQIAQPLDNGGNAAGQVMLASASQGLVAFDAGGDLIGALAERWIVEDDGESYIFRLRHTHWADGGAVKAEEVARLLRARFAANPALLAGLTPQVRGMTDEVLEIRLPGSAPSFLQILAHPALAVARRDGGTGPFRKTRKGDLVTLTPVAPGDRRDDATTAADAEAPLPLYVRAVRPAIGFARFQRHESDLLLGGRFQHLPYVTAASPPTRAVRADPVNGLLGLVVEGRSAFLANRDVRDALAMAINRERLAQRLNLAGWRTATNILPAQMDLPRPPAQIPWSERELALRQSYARSVVTNWTRAHGAPGPIRIALPAGPGARMLHESLRQDYAAIGLPVTLVDWTAKDADMRLIDEVAPFDSALWYLTRIGCGLNALCSADAAAQLAIARHAATEPERAAALAAAETLSLAEATYIPLGMPIRFALVRNRLTGYQPSPRARHPLNSLFRDPR